MFPFRSGNLRIEAIMFPFLDKNVIILSTRNEPSFIRGLQKEVAIRPSHLILCLDNSYEKYLQEGCVVFDLRGAKGFPYTKYNTLTRLLVGPAKTTTSLMHLPNEVEIVGWYQTHNPSKENPRDLISAYEVALAVYFFKHLNRGYLNVREIPDHELRDTIDRFFGTNNLLA